MTAPGGNGKPRLPRRIRVGVLHVARVFPACRRCRHGRILERSFFAVLASAVRSSVRRHGGRESCGAAALLRRGDPGHLPQGRAKSIAPSWVNPLAVGEIRY